MSNTELSSSALGLNLMKATLGSCELGQLTSELASRLTAMEKLGLLSDTGKSLMSLLQRMTATPFTAGSAVKKEDSGTFTFRLGSDWQVSPRDWLSGAQGPNITCQSPGHSSPVATNVSMTHG